MTVAGQDARRDADHHQVLESGRRQAGCAVEQLWVQYLGLGGGADLFTLDAFLHGACPLPPAEQDILANVINEELDDRCRAAQVPYLVTLGTAATRRDPLTVIDELFGAQHQESPGPR